MAGFSHTFTPDTIFVLKISIITAVYNRANLIASAMQCVASQSYPHIEHVIQDGGSKDGTLDVVYRNKTLTTQIESRPDRGIYEAINSGISRASGDVIGFMHSDDIYSNNSILAKVAMLFEDPSVDGVYGDLDYVSSHDTARIIRRWRSGHFALGRLRQGWMPPHPTLYLRRQVYDDWGLYDTSYRISADYEAMLRYLSKGKITLAYLPEVMVKMRVGGESNRSLSKILQKSREDYRAIRTNEIGGIGTLAWKNLSKIKQFT